MDRQPYFSTKEMIGYFLLIIIGLNIVVAIPLVIKLYPVIENQISNLNDNPLQFDFMVNDLLGANIAWQVLSLLILMLLFHHKKIRIADYFEFNKNIIVNNFLLVAFLFIILMFFLNPVSDYFDVPQNPTMKYLFENGNIILIFITAIIAAPIIEEFIFRGWIFNELERRYNQVLAFHASSILFTIIHIQYGAIEMLLVLAIAYALAFLRIKTRNLIFPIALHFLNNLGALIEYLISTSK